MLVLRDCRCWWREGKRSTFAVKSPKKTLIIFLQLLGKPVKHSLKRQVPVLLIVLIVLTTSSVFSPTEHIQLLL